MGWLVKPWGVVILIVCGLEALALNVTGGLLMWEAKREIRAARAVSACASALVDSLGNAPYRVNPSDTLRHRLRCS